MNTDKNLNLPTFRPSIGGAIPWIPRSDNPATHLSMKILHGKSLTSPIISRDKASSMGQTSVFISCYLWFLLSEECVKIFFRSRHCTNLGEIARKGEIFTCNPTKIVVRNRPLLDEGICRSKGNRIAETVVQKPGILQKQALFIRRRLPCRSRMFEV